MIIIRVLFFINNHLNLQQQPATAVNFNRGGDYFASGGQDDKVSEVDHLQT